MENRTVRLLLLQSYGQLGRRKQPPIPPRPTIWRSLGKRLSVVHDAVANERGRNSVEYEPQRTAAAAVELPAALVSWTIAATTATNVLIQSFQK